MVTFGQKYQTFRMKILIVEDDPFVAGDLKDKLDQLQYRITGVADSFESALESIKQSFPDLVLLDIELKGELTGIDLSEELNKNGIPFIYLSSIQDLNTYYKAKETKPLKNLPKPIDLLNLRNALLDIQASETTSSQSNDLLCFFTNKDGIRVRIEPENIVYLEASKVYCDVHFIDNTRSTLTMAMGNVVKKLNYPDLIQIHKSYYINKKHIKHIRGNEVELVVGPYLRISDSHKEAFKRLVNIF